MPDRFQAMPPAEFKYSPPLDSPRSVIREDDIESGFTGRLQGLKYDYRPDITNRAMLEQNFREKFGALNRVRLTDSEFVRLVEEIVEYKNDPCNGYTKTLLCFPQSFIVSNCGKSAESERTPHLFSGELELSLVA